jgi:hypothetical protein
MGNEKFDEKEMEKREEKSADDRGWDEKWRRDPLSSIVWAVILVWAGLVLLVGNLGIIEQFSRLPGLGFLASLSAWGIILVGAGFIILLEVLVRLLVPAYRRPVGGSLVFALILIGLGLGNLFSWNILWPLILIAIGLVVILRGFLR